MTWPSVPIRDVCKVIGGGTPKKSIAEYYGGRIPWVTPKDMKSWHIIGSQVKISESGVANSPCKVVPENSVLVVVRSGVLKHSLPIAINRVPVTINQDMKALICSDRVDPAYLARFISESSPKVLSWVRATTADNFPVANLMDLRIPLPSLDEQKRISAVLNQADALRVQRRESLKILDELEYSIFLGIFGSPDANPNGYSAVSLSQLLTEKLHNGISPSKDGGIVHKVLTLSAITSNTFLPGKWKDGTFREDPPVKKIVTSDLFMICRGNGNMQLVGRGVFPTCDMLDTVYPDTILAAPVKQELVLPEYLTHFWALPVVRRQIERMARTTNGTYKVNQKTMGAVEILLPPLEAQRQFQEIAQSILTERYSLMSHLKELDALFASMQARAFRGELWETVSG